MEKSEESAIACFLTAPIPELGGSVMLIGACCVSKDSRRRDAISESVVVFPGSTEKIANRINNIYEDSDYLKITDVKLEAEKSLERAAIAFQSCVIKKFIDLHYGIDNYISQRKNLTEEDFIDLTHKQSTRNQFNLTNLQTKIPQLNKWMTKSYN
jgi:hypothetical protein